MAPQTAKSLMKDFRASFRRSKKAVDSTPKVNAAKEAEELAKLTEMKESLGDQLPPGYTDFDLLGFLRARSLNVKDAEKLLQLDVNVKRLLNMDTFRPPEDISLYSFCGRIGWDKEGSLVRVINVGGADSKGIMNIVSTLEGFKILLWMVSEDRKLQEEHNKKSDTKSNQFVYIVDLRDLTMAQVSYKPAFDTGMQTLKLLQDHYHDALKSVYFINAPSFFSSVYKLFKPVIQDSLQEKIRIFDGDSGKEELLKQIGANMLPKYLGGERVDSYGDPECKEFVNFGTVVPEELYANNFLSAEDPDVVVATVPAGSFLNFRFPIRKIGSVAEWHFQGKDNDIGIGLYHEPFSSGSETPRTRKRKEEDMSKFEQMTPIIRYQCHVCPVVGSATLWFTGNVIVHFDNSYSWMNSKDVLFRITVKPPAEANKVNSIRKGLEKLNLR